MRRYGIYAWRKIREQMDKLLEVTVYLKNI